MAKSLPRDPDNPCFWDRFDGRSFNLMAITIALLTIFGLAVVYSASQGRDVLAIMREYNNHPDVLPGSFSANREFLQQLVGTVGALIVGWIVSQYKPWRTALPLGIPLLLLLGITVYTSLMGDTLYGARRSYRLLGIAIQPAEFLRLILPIWVSTYLAERWSYLDKNIIVFYYPLIPIGIATAAVLYSPDLEGGLLMFIAGAMPLLVAGINRSLVVTSVALVFILGLLQLVSPGKVYRLERIYQWLQPLREMFPFLQDIIPKVPESQQIIKAHQIIDRGGLFGVGPGQSLAKYDNVPSASADFIYSILLEEYGVLGGLVAVALFVMLIMLSFYVMQRHPEPVGNMIAGALMISIGAQSAINIFSVLKLLPITGLNLPMFSTGLSSRVAISVALMVLLRLAYETDKSIMAARLEDYDLAQDMP